MDSWLCAGHVNYGCAMTANAFVVGVSVIYLVALFAFNLRPQYGRFYDGPWWAGRGIDPKLSWILQESPSFFLPFCTLVFNVNFFARNPFNAFFLVLFSGHYFNRTFVYPLLIKGGKPSSLLTVVFAFFFCLINGFLQSHHFLCIAQYPASYYGDFRFLLGVVLFAVGFIGNVHSDGLLRNLRKPGETGYKIPTGGMFEYVSSANLFAEIVEWWGFWIASFSHSAFAFAVLTTVILTCKAYLHQRFVSNF